MDSKAHHSTPVADDWNWTARVRNEFNCQKMWQRNWGFLLEQQQHEQEQAGAAPPAALAAPAAGPSGRDSLAAFMQQSSSSGGGAAAPGPSSPSALSYIAAKQRDSARARRLEGQDSLDGFVSNYVTRGDAKARMLPAEEFKKPLTTSQEYGWGRSLEKFGTLQLVMK